MANLLKQTIECLEENGKTIDDVIMFKLDNVQMTKDVFVNLANVEYDDGYGGNEISSNLVLWGKDFIMDRGEYDGSEWWNFTNTSLPKDIPFSEVKTLLEEWFEKYKKYIDNDGAIND